MGRLESYNAVAAAILGQSEVFISIKNNYHTYLSALTASNVDTVSASSVRTFTH